MRVINFTAGTEGNRRISDISELGTVRVSSFMSVRVLWLPYSRARFAG